MGLAPQRPGLVFVDRVGRPLTCARRRLVTAPVVVRPRGVLPGLAPLPWRIRVVTPGSQSYTTNGTFSFAVPEYNTLAVDVKGAGGGGGGGSGGAAGGSGGQGGRAQKSWAYGAAGAPVPGSTITVVVGLEGSGGTPGDGGGAGGTAARGSVAISWS